MCCYQSTANSIRLEVSWINTMRISMPAISPCQYIIHFASPELILAASSLSHIKMFDIPPFHSLSKRPLSDPQYRGVRRLLDYQRSFLSSPISRIIALEVIRDEIEMTGSMGIKMEVPLLLMVHKLTPCRYLETTIWTAVPSRTRAMLHQRPFVQLTRTSGIF